MGLPVLFETAGSAKNAWFAASLLALCGLVGVAETSAVHAAEINEATVKTMHVKLRHNDVGFGMDEDTFRDVYKCAGGVPPPLPEGTHPLIADPGTAFVSQGSEVDIYWSGTRLAVYKKGARYKLVMPGCTWAKEVIDGAEIYDYKDRSAYLVNFTTHSAKKGRGEHYSDPPSSAMRKRYDDAYAKTVLGQDVIAGHRCDEKSLFPGGKPVICVLSSMHRFPGTGNYIFLRQEQKPARVSLGVSPTMGAWKQEATLVEANIFIPEEKFRVPAGFQVGK